MSCVLQVYSSNRPHARLLTRPAQYQPFLCYLLVAAPVRWSSIVLTASCRAIGVTPWGAALLVDRPCGNRRAALVLVLGVMLTTTAAPTPVGAWWVVAVALLLVVAAWAVLWWVVATIVALAVALWVAGCKTA